MAQAAARRSKRRKWVLVGGIGIVALALGLTAFLLTRPQQSAGFVRTQTVKVTKSTQTVTVGLSGTLAPKNQADLSFSSAGTVTSVKVKVGQKVSKNQVVATIDATDLANAVALARANLTAARTSYSDAVDNDASSSQRSAALAQVRSAEAQLSSAELALKKANSDPPSTAWSPWSTSPRGTPPAARVPRRVRSAVPAPAPPPPRRVRTWSWCRPRAGRSTPPSAPPMSRR
ncbi:MAG: biotin/lipoyl-binding protein [Micropruina sp.]|nr:MAG: biotin/lipoyl-binding protein [Micropruina sp.]